MHGVSDAGRAAAAVYAAGVDYQPLKEAGYYVQSVMVEELMHSHMLGQVGLWLKPGMTPREAAETVANVGATPANPLWHARVDAYLAGVKYAGEGQEG